MFIGPFTVYLGGLMGPRRILLTAAALFTVLLSSCLRAQLQPGDCNGIPRRPDLRHVLSTHAHVRASELPLDTFLFTLGLVRNLRGRGGDIAPSLYGWYRTIFRRIGCSGFGVITPLM